MKADDKKYENKLEGWSQFGPKTWFTLIVGIVVACMLGVAFNGSVGPLFAVGYLVGRIIEAGGISQMRS